MKHHEIDLLDLQEWMRETETVYASQLPLKKLTITMVGSFKLYHNGIVIWEGVQPFRAVEKYNEI